MCESKVLIRRDGSEELVMEDVAHLKVVEGGVELVRIDGLRKEVKGVELDEIDFIHHKAYLKQA